MNYKQKIYISGKITGLDYEEVTKKFNDIENKCIEHYSFYYPKEQLYVFNPTTIPEYIKYETALSRCINVISSGYDVIVMIDGWETSKGAILEVVVAQHLGLRIVDQNFKQINNDKLPTIRFSNN